MKIKETKIILLLKAFFTALGDNGDRANIENILPPSKSKSINPLLTPWQAFYQQNFNLACDFSSLTLPPKRQGFDRLLVIAQGLTPQLAFDQCQKRFPCWKWCKESLDVKVTSNARASQNGPYAVWVRDRVEADEEHKNKSANELKQAGVKGITLTERIIYELKYFLETGQHLDIKNITLCSGSVYSDGYIPRAFWFSAEFEVYWRGSGHAIASLRAREVVSS